MTGRKSRHVSGALDCVSRESLRVSSYSRVPSNVELQAYEDLIRRLILRRVELKISQMMLDHKLGVTDGLVAKWESMKRLPSMFMLACWCGALRVTLVPIEPDPELKLGVRTDNQPLVESRVK